LITKDDIAIATIGKSVGLRGELKLHLLSDFPEQFTKNSVFKSQNAELTIQNYNHSRGIVKFVGYDSIEDTKKLINKNLFSDIQKTKQQCNLGKNEYFYFDIIGCIVVEDSKKLGEVVNIERFGGDDYLVVKSNSEFLIPYVDRYILSVDVDGKTINTKDATYLQE